VDVRAGTPIMELENLVRDLIKDRDRLTSELEKTLAQGTRSMANVILDLVELKDEFDRVFTNIEPRLECADRQAKIWTGNFKTIKRSLEKRLRERNVVPIESPEGKAIPGFHTIVETRENLELPEWTILDTLLPGYIWQGKILRQAQVTTVKNS